jgi:hypothetical protein
MRPKIFKAEELGGLGLKLYVYAPLPDSVLAQGFTKIKIEKRSGGSSSWSELTTSSTRISLASGVCLYTIIDTTPGLTTDFYRSIFTNDSGTISGPAGTEIEGSTVGYISVSDAIAAGVSPTISVEQINAAILGEQSFIEEYTGVWFEPRHVSVEFDGDGNRHKHFPVPILQVDGLYVNSDFSTAVPEEDYFWHKPGDYRHHTNPKIVLKTDKLSPPWSQTPGLSSAVFYPGIGNQKLVGVLGRVDASGSPPYKIRQALVRMVTRSLAGDGLSGPDPTVQAGVLTRVVVKDHVRVYTPLYRNSTRAQPPTSAMITGDSFVDGVLRHFRRAPRISDGKFSFMSM